MAGVVVLGGALALGVVSLVSVGTVVAGLGESSSSRPNSQARASTSARPPTTAMMPITIRRVRERRRSAFTSCSYRSWRLAFWRWRFSVPTSAEGYRRLRPPLGRVVGDAVRRRTLDFVAIVRMFAAAREAAGTGRDDVPGRTVAEVLGAARQRYGERFAEVLATCRIWVNGDAADDATEVGPADEVAVLPPVSGGAT